MANLPFNARVFRSFESSSRYSPGGYHPLSIGDTLNSGRYRVLHRLGHGSYSTVWLAEDLHYGTCNSTPLPPARYVALKILAADVPAAKRDSRILRKIEEQPLSTVGLLVGLLSWIPGFGSEKKAVQNTGRDFIIRLYDEFDIEGPNGSHHVLVMEFVGPSLSAVKKCDDLNLDRLPIAIGLRGVSQLAKAVWFLHSKGVVHGGLLTTSLVKSAANRRGQIYIPAISPSLSQA
jgi:serine/threonine protein kinase